MRNNQSAQQELFLEPWRTLMYNSIPTPSQKNYIIKRFEQTESKLKSMNIYIQTLTSNYT